MSFARELSKLFGGGAGDDTASDDIRDAYELAITGGGRKMVRVKFLRRVDRGHTIYNPGEEYDIPQDQADLMNERNPETLEVVGADTPTPVEPPENPTPVDKPRRPPGSPRGRNRAMKRGEAEEK